MVDKKTLLIDKVAGLPDKASILNDYVSLTNAIVSIYHYDVKLSKISSNYDIEKLPEPMKTDAISLIHKENFVFLIVNKLFDNEPVAFSMYKELYKDNSSMILEETDILSDDALYTEYMGIGGGFRALMEMNANYWLGNTDLL